MSWDIFVQDLPIDVRSLDDVPHDFVPASIGARSEVIRKIKKVVPCADFSDASWGIIDGEGFSIEVNPGLDEELRSFAFHVRGGDEAARVISEILTSLNLRALDTSTGEIFALRA